LKRGDLNWALARVFHDDNKFDIVELPLSFDKNINAQPKKDGSLLGSHNRIEAKSKLIFLKNKSNGFVHTSIMTVQPNQDDIEYEDFQYKKLPTNFAGTVFYSNWDGSFNNGWAYKDGFPSKSINIKTPIGHSAGYANPNGNGENCEDYVIETWQRYCINYTDGSQDCTDWDLVASHNITICGSGSGSGGAGEYIETVVTEEEMLEMFDDEISEEELISCLKTVFSELKGLEGGKFADIIREFSGTIPNFNWKLKSSPLGLGDANAVTGSLPIEGYFVTTFNTSWMAGASDLSIARTMIHEAIHAYLSYYHFANVPAYTGTYLELLRQYRTSVANQNVGDEQHFIMEKAFVEQVIAPALQQYGNSKGYNLDFTYYKDLAWGGLNFNGNNQLSATDKIRIESRLAAEQTGTGAGTVPCPIAEEQ
jgi:hypothetical protein